MIDEKELHAKTVDVLKGLVQAGELREVLCFAYCGDDHCNCTGRYYQIVSDQIRKEMLESANT